MRNDHRPLWIRRIQEGIESWYARHFIYPQFDSVGDAVEINAPWRLEVYGENISLGHNAHIQTSNTVMTRLCTWPNAEGKFGTLSIGNHVLLTPGLHIVCSDRVEIGDNVMLASHVYISDSDWHDIYDRTAAPGAHAPVTLKNNVWIGIGSKVLKGVTIGENTIIGAGSVVTKSIGPNVIAAGNPAKVIGKLDRKRAMVKREAMFAPEKNYQGAIAYLKMLKNGPNKTLNWLQSYFFPNRTH